MRVKVSPNPNPKPNPNPHPNPNSGGVRYATPVAPEGFSGVANNLLRGFFSSSVTSKSDAPHSQPSAASNVYIGSASNWPL